MDQQRNRRRWKKVVGSRNDFLKAFKAKILTSTGRYEEAIQYCNKTIDNCYKICETQYWSKNITLAYALTIKGNALCYLRKYNEAISCYDKALQINPDYALAQTNKQIIMQEELDRYSRCIFFE